MAKTDFNYIVELSIDTEDIRSVCESWKNNNYTINVTNAAMPRYHSKK